MGVVPQGKGLIPAGLVPGFQVWLGRVGEAVNRCFSLTLVLLSLSFSLPSLLSKKRSKIIFLKKRNEEKYLYLRINKQKSHTAVLSVDLLSSILPIPTPRPTLSSSLRAVCSRCPEHGTNVYLLSQEVGVSLSWESEVEFRKLNLYSVVQDSFQLYFLEEIVLDGRNY